MSRLKAMKKQAEALDRHGRELKLGIVFHNVPKRNAQKAAENKMLGMATESPGYTERSI